MRVLLRHTLTGEYLKATDAWTKSRQEAMAFKTTAQAIGFATEYKLDDVEILLDFDDPQYDIRLPVNPRGPNE